MNWLATGWVLAIAIAAGVRIWNALFGPLFYGYDTWAHVSYIFFLDLHHSLPYADQGWSYFHPPLYYALGWGVAQWTGAEGMIRGLGLLGGAASLGIAGLAALLIRRCLPGHPGLPLIAFTTVAFLPVHVYTSAMTGNEMFAGLLASAGLCSFLLNERRDQPKLGLDLVTGLLLGLAALAKASGLSMLAAVGVGALLGKLLRPERSSTKQLAVRVAAIGGVALVLAGPFYLRTMLEFGTPFQLSRDFSPMLEFELAQEPGERSWRDFVAISPKLFSDPASDAPHLIHSVWGNVYLSMWFDTYGASQLPVAVWNVHDPRSETLTRVFALLGIVPTLLALFGAALSARAVFRERSLPDLSLLLVCGLSLGSFAAFAFQIPSWAALKASYLMALSLPYAFFVARALLELWTRRPLLGYLAAAPLGVAALATAFVFTSGAALEMHEDKREMAGVHLLFGELDESRERWLRAAQRYGLRSRVVSDGLAAVELAAGNHAEARRLYRGALRRPLHSHPYRSNRLVVAAALDGDRDAAASVLKQAWIADYPELLVNRGALHLADGDAETAEADLRRAIAAAPDLEAAWINLAEALDEQGRAADAEEARDRARALAGRAPRGFPYGVGNGDLRAIGGNQRWMLLAREGELQLYRPARARP